MDKFRKELIEVIVAVETEDPRLPRIIQRITGGFNRHTEFQYHEVLRRGKDDQAKREAIRPTLPESDRSDSDTLGESQEGGE